MIDTGALQLPALTAGLDLRSERDRLECRRRARRAHERLRVSEIHSEALRLTGMTFTRYRKALWAIADAWLEDATEFHRLFKEPHA